MIPVTAAMKMYDFAMNQVLKLKGIFNILFENGYLLLIVLAIVGILIYYLLKIAIKLKMGLSTSSNNPSEDKTN